MSNPSGKVVPSSGGRRLVISDIHGCHKTLHALIQKIDLSADDQLFFLGDYVNKGPSGKKALDFVIELSEKYKVFPLLGNHDLMLLNFLVDGDEAAKANLSEMNSQEFFELEAPEKEKYIAFLSSLHHYFISDEFILVHAGLNFNLSNPFLGKEDMLNIRSFYYESSKAQNKSIVHGHLPNKLNEIKNKIQERSKILPLDNGCVYFGEREEMGDLLCLELETFKLISQTNCEDQR